MSQDTPNQRTDDDWRRILTPEQYRVLRGGGTERAFTGALVHHHDSGTYRCAGCGQVLFASTSKYDSGSGWPSFWEPLQAEGLSLVADHGHGMVRVEVRCGRCDSHLGHVFDDGPRPTGKRYCINSLSLEFAPDDSK